MALKKGRYRDVGINFTLAEGAPFQNGVLEMQKGFKAGTTVDIGSLGIPPVIGSPAVVSLLTQKAEELFGGKFVVEVDPIKASQTILSHIKSAREKLGIAE